MTPQRTALLGAVVGGVVGSLVPGVGTLLGAQIGFTGGAILGSLLFPTKDDVAGPTGDDVRISSAATGRAIPIVYGVVRVAGQFIWVDEPFFHTRKDEVGKGGSQEVKTTVMYLTWAVGICEGPVAAVTRIWLDGELVFDISENNPNGPALTRSAIPADLPSGVTLSTTTQTVAMKQYGPIRIYLGVDDQPEEPLFLSDERIGAAYGGATADYVPAMNGLCYAVFERIPGDVINGHFPQCEFEVVKSANALNTSLHFEPLTDAFVRDRYELLPDLVTYISIPNDTTPGLIHRWNTVDKNPDAPQSYYARLTDGTLASTAGDRDFWVPANVGTWDDPDLIGFAKSGALNIYKWNFNTGYQIGTSRSVSIGGQPSVMYYYPDTLAPQQVIVLFDTQNQVLSFPFAFPNPLGEIAHTSANDFPIPQLGIAGASWKVNSPGFIGPDGFLYVATGETDSTKNCIIALNPYNLNVERAVFPYRSSPDTDDPFYDSMDLTYDKQTDKIVIFSENGYARRVDRATLTVDNVPDLAISYTNNNSTNRNAIKAGPYNGRIWIATAFNSYREIDIWNWLITDTISNAQSTYGIDGNNNDHTFDPINQGLWVEDFLDLDQLDFLPLGRQTPNCTTAGAIAADISDRCDVNSALRSTSLWTDTICGYVIGRRISGRKALEPIAGAINGDLRTQDGVVQFFKLTTSSIKTIAEDDLGAAETIDAKVPGRDVRWPYERELPYRVDIEYIDRAFDYSINSQGFDRPLEGFKGRSRETVQIPIVFDADSDPTPVQIAERLLYQFDANRRMHQLSLTWKHLNLNVGDAFAYTSGSFTTTCRVEKFALGENNKILIEAKQEDVSINTASGGAGTSGSVVFETPTLTAGLPVTLFMIDSSLLRDLDDVSNGIPIYAAVAPAGVASWPGALLLRSSDGGSTYNPVGAFDSSQAIYWGIASNALGDARAGVTDTTNTLTINMRYGTLGGPVNKSDLDEDRSLNALLVGAPGRWEVVRYQTITDSSGSPDESGDTYVISNLRRGQRGTNTYIDTHVAGDYVLVLDATKLIRITLDTSELSVARLYKAVTLGVNESLVPAQSFTLGGETKKPYTLAQAAGSRNISTGTWTFTATRRSRVGGAWVDFTEPPLGEESEEYLLEVLDGPGGTAVITKDGLTSPSTTVTSAEFAAAGLGSGSPNDDMVSPFAVAIKWYQISATVGRGNTVEVHLSSPTPGN